jgi:hypothetical protein
VGGLLSQARDAATRATISKIQGLLNSRSQAFDRLLKRKGYLPGTAEYQQVQANYRNVITQSSTKSMLTTKILQVKFFPQRYQEVYDPYIYRDSSGQTPIAQATASNAEILYYFLTQSNALGDSPVANDTFSPSEVKDIDTDGLPEFVDAWGNPLRFYRWPTRLFRSQGQNSSTGALNAITCPTGPNATSTNADGSYDTNNAQLLFSSLPVFTGNLQVDLARDPQDPLQDCLTIFQSANNLKPFEFASDPYYPVLFHTPATYHVLLVVSAGPDGVLGLYEPDFIDLQNNIRGDLGQIKDVAALNDVIVSLSIRAGGK